jgi:hypothetical protein
MKACNRGCRCSLESLRPAFRYTRLFRNMFFMQREGRRVAHQEHGRIITYGFHDCPWNDCRNTDNHLLCASGHQDLEDKIDERHLDRDVQPLLHGDPLMGFLRTRYQIPPGHHHKHRNLYSCIYHPRAEAAARVIRSSCAKPPRKPLARGCALCKDSAESTCRESEDNPSQEAPGTDCRCRCLFYRTFCHSGSITIHLS